VAMPFPPTYSPSGFTCRLPHMIPTASPPGLVTDIDAVDECVSRSRAPSKNRGLVEEVSALRREIAQHQQELLALVTDRLNAMGARAEDAGAGCVPICSAMTRDVPERLNVSVLSGFSAFAGFYDLMLGMRHNGMPVWEAHVGDRRLFALKTGRWAIGRRVSSSSEPDDSEAEIFCVSLHGGGMPHGKAEAWRKVSSAAREDLIVEISVKPSPPTPVSRAAFLPIRLDEEEGGDQLLTERSRRFLPMRLCDEEGGDQLLAERSRRTLRLDRIRASHRMANGGESIPEEKDFPISRKPRRMFADAEAMKEQLRRNIHCQEMREEDYYTTEGACQRIARKPWFEYLSLAVIAFNACWIGYDLDTNTADALTDADWGHQLMENLFVLYFVVEIGIRLRSFRDLRNIFHVQQFAFDASLVLLMVVETWVMYIILLISGGSKFVFKAGSLSVLRILRITRVVRLVRLLRALPELMILIKGLAAASRSVAWTMCLLVIIIYVFAVAFRILTRNDPIGAKYFPDLKTSMITLLLPGLLPDNADTVMDIGGGNLFYGIFFMCFILIAAITVMNMLIGVLVESVSAVAAVEKEALNLEYVKSELSSLMKDIDKDEDDRLSRTEIAGILGSPEAMRIISKVGVDVDGLIDVADFYLFNKKDNITFSEFLELVLQLRGNNTTTVRDIVDLRKFVLDELLILEERFTSLLQGLEDGRGVGRSTRVTAMDMPIRSSSNRLIPPATGTAILDIESPRRGLTSSTSPRGLRATGSPWPSTRPSTPADRTPYE